MQSSAMSFVPVLQQLAQPALILQGDRIRYANLAAQQLALMPDQPAGPLLAPDGNSDYTLLLGDRSFRATGTQWEDGTLLLLQEAQQLTLPVENLARVAASLRNPLSDLIASCNELFPYLEEQEDSFVQAKTAVISRAHYRLLRALTLVGDECALLEGSRDLLVERTELCSFFDELTTSAAGFAEELGISLTLTLPDRLFTGDVDRGLLERAVYNLIVNAVRHSAKGDTVHLRLEQQHDRAVLRVQDEGPGLDPELLAKISEPGGTAGVGAGFGLSFVRSVAELHGGSLLLNSRPGEGLTAVFSFNLTPAPDAKISSPREGYDYSGGLEHGHVEFSDLMPDTAYDSRCI